MTHCAPSRWRWPLLVVATAAFALAYTEYTLYDGNYNTYLLHGLGEAGHGSLGADWMVSTRDPFPLVSAIVAATYRLGSPALFYGYHAALLGVYLLSILQIAATAFDFEAWSPRGVTFVGIAVLVHSAMFRALVKAVSGGDWGWYLQSGLAMQYLLGFVFQPSLFGVLLVASLAAFLRGRDRMALALGAAAVAAHFSYCLTFVALALAYGIVRWRDARARGSEAGLRIAARVWLLGLALLVPIMAVVLVRFAPADAAARERAQAILVDIRIPHHTLVRRWVHPSMWIQLPLVSLGVLVARRSRVAIVMLTLAAVALALTLAQVATESRGLALLFPWRISIVLVPLATSLLVGRLVAAAPAGRWGRASAGVFAAVALAAAAFGGVTTWRQMKDYATDPALPMMAYVKAHASAADLYVVPTDMQRFRLETGTRTFADWKSHPYRDREVLEWYRRIEAARALQSSQGDALCEKAANLSRREGASHFVLPAKKPVGCAGLVERYRDDQFAVFEAAPRAP